MSASLIVPLVHPLKNLSHDASVLGSLIAQAESYLAMTENLRRLIDPRLSAQVSVVACSEGVLSLLCPSSTCLSQWRYAQRSCIAKLRQDPAFSGLTRLRLILAQPVHTSAPAKAPAVPRQLSPATRELLRKAAQCMEDRELSLALLALASHDTDQEKR